MEFKLNFKLNFKFAVVCVYIGSVFLYFPKFQMFELEHFCNGENFY